MGIAHLIYIPFAVIIGVVLGFILGARATQDALRRERERAASAGARAGSGHDRAMTANETPNGR